MVYNWEVIFMRNIIVEKLNQTPIEKQDIEIVERKGIGHPDSISDGIAESVSRALCNAYLERFGAIMHHNTDEVQITAGESNPEFGGGEIIKPMDILLTGRGIAEIDGQKIGLDRIAISAAKDFLKENIINLDVETCAVVECKIGHGSGDLTDVFARTGSAPLSNDTSFGVGFAPFSETETIVMEAENLLNSSAFKNKYPAVGEDIKVMGLREGDDITLTVASAMVDKYVDDLDGYLEAKHNVRDEVLKLAAKHSSRNLEVYVNTADRCEDDGQPSVYITVTGTSAEMGDDGSVGRGNRANGLITPNRPMSMEATSGKNPINHVGKIYNLLSNQMAADIVKSVEGVNQAHIMILSQIGKPIDDPRAATSQIILQEGYKMEDVEKKVESVMDTWLQNTSSITEMLVKGKLRTF
jgi:S-adenosylmethionine synthetase